jgi:hypothetical protein
VEDDPPIFSPIVPETLPAKFIGGGAFTKAECEESFGKDARACREYSAKP